MKLETRLDEKKFLEIIRELREETNHLQTHIFSSRLNACMWVYQKAKNKAQAKDWIKVELGW